jgi:Raf kinase inhibitor-like YbhB/YbcL family protein
MSTANGFVVSSPTLPENADISADQYLNSFGCTGKNERPVLTWSGAPEGTRSFAVTFYDQDAPTGSGFWHWVVFDIPVGITSLADGPIPEGARESNTDFGVPGYFGPCPPIGRRHRYTFYVHALDTEQLEVPENATGALAGFFIHRHTLAKISFTVIAGPRTESPNA